MGILINGDLSFYTETSQCCSSWLYNEGLVSDSMHLMTTY